MLVEAAWVAVKTPGPLRAFYERVRARRGMQIAVVATARKLAVLCWHMITCGEDYAFARPSLTAKKLRALELQGRPAVAPWPEGQRLWVLAQGCPRAREAAGRARRARLPPARRRLAGQRPAVQGGRGRRQWGATLKALRRGNSCAAGTSPRSCASLGGRPRPPRSLTPADSPAQRSAAPAGTLPDARNRPDPGDKRRDRGRRSRSAALPAPAATDTTPQDGRPTPAKALTLSSVVRDPLAVLEREAQVRDELRRMVVDRCRIADG